MATAVRKTNWFAIWTSIAVVVIIAILAGVVVWMNNAASAPTGGATPQGSNINSDTGAVIVNAGAPNTLDTYIDFMCPVCNQFEQIYGDTIQQQVDAGTLTLNIHPISILDRLSQNTQYSTRAASAMYCVAEGKPDKVVDFMKAMYEHQPQENSAGLTDDEIVQVAVGAGVTGVADVKDCITSHRFAGYVTDMTYKTPVQPGKSGIATPTVVLNGDILSLTGDPQADIVANLKK
jgi:protein-disulfide isomerase